MRELFRLWCLVTVLGLVFVFVSLGATDAYEIAKYQDDSLPKYYGIQTSEEYPDQIVVVVDMSNLANNLYLNSVKAFVGFYGQDKKTQIAIRPIVLGSNLRGGKIHKLVKSYPSLAAEYVYVTAVKLTWDGGELKGTKGDNSHTVGDAFIPIHKTSLSSDWCIQGFVWREARPSDHVCVTPAIRSQTASENARAGSRRNPNGGPYGPDTCLEGFVWREAFPGDRVCVSVESRTQAQRDNQQAAARRIR